MAVSLADALRNARHRLEQHQPGRPLQICKEDLLALVRFAECPPKVPSTKAEVAAWCRMEAVLRGVP